MKTKTFDCVKMKRNGARKVIKNLTGKNRQQQLEYWRKGTEKLKDLQQEFRNKT